MTTWRVIYSHRITGWRFGVITEAEIEEQARRSADETLARELHDHMADWEHVKTERWAGELPAPEPHTFLKKYDAQGSYTVTDGENGREN